MTPSPLPSNAEVAAALGAVFGDRVMLAGTTFEVAADVLRIIRIASGSEGYWLRSADNDETVRWVEAGMEREMSIDDKLRRALEPFACVAVEWDGEPESLEVELRAYDNRMCPGIPVAAFRAAREALAATQEQPARFNGEQALTEWEGKHGGGK